MLKAKRLKSMFVLYSACAVMATGFTSQAAVSYTHLHKIKELGYTPGLQPEADYFAIKMPVFSFEKIRGADISLGPEMKSTGECLGIAKTFDEALYKAFIGAGVKLPKHKNMICLLYTSRCV